VGYNYLENPAVMHCKTLVERGAIGRITRDRASHLRMTNPVGAARGSGCHQHRNGHDSARPP